jgi:hypothetical protein
LTPAEWRSVVQHPRIGQVILEHAAALRDAVPIILHHHERFGGHGYPYGLRANEIPLGARIVAIADAYDAMINDRPYQRAMSHDAAVAELRLHAGTQFDPELVVLFCDLYADRAPLPDPSVLDMMERPPIRSTRRERRTRESTTVSQTMAADGQGLVDLGRPRRPDRTKHPHFDPDGPPDGQGSTPDERGIATG